MTNPKTDMVAQFEQIEMSAIQVAIVTGSYYKKLVEEGLPENLVFELVTNFHNLWWSTMYSGKFNRSDE